ncbi:muscarinic acetylcholine receptor M1 [Chanos chanos]|uniref:Muscarinic acetylcholine receptor n=1 Tax=Chanos chanos TaxID=29144 RepID=A0A6J2VZ56_CHACN|nr:muscarinic acetylcholine receptor M1-like [Chanos chanos]
MNYTCVSQATNLTMDPLGGHQIWEVVLIVLVTGPLSLVTILGNLLVFISFRVNAQLRTVSNYFLLSLAVADLTLGIVSMNLYTAYIILNRWPLGQLACDLWLALDYVASNASVMNLLLISFDRYFSVTRPLTYRAKRTTKRAAVMIALAWVVSFVLWGPAILFWPHVVGRSSEDEEVVQNCSIPFLNEPVLTFGTAIAAFYLPVSIMIILYWRIYWEIENRSKGFAGFMGSNNTGEASSDGSTRQSVYSNSGPSPSREMHAGKGHQQSWKGPVGCFPKRQKLSPLVVNRKAAKLSQIVGENYREACSTSSWNVDEEDDDDDGAMSTSTEEEQEQSMKGSGLGASNPVVIRLRDLQEGKFEGSHGTHLSTSRAADPKDSPPCRGSSFKKCSKSLDLSLRKMSKAKQGANMIIREKKAARTLSAILLAFIITWTPYNIMVLASISYCIPDKLWQLGYWLCYVNSTINPVCYALCNKSFRVTFKRLLLCRYGNRRKWQSSRHGYHASVRLQKSCSMI